MIVQNAQLDAQQVDRHQHADRRHHLGREHPQQDVLGALGRRERHRPGRRNGDDDAEQRRAAGDDHRVPEEAHVVRALLNHGVVLQRPVEEQDDRRVGDRLGLGLEAGQDRPEDREEDQQADGPRDRGVEGLALGRDGACHGQSLLSVQVLADDAHQEDGDDVGENDCVDTAGRAEADVLALQHALVDQVGQRPGAERALRGHEDLGEDGQQEDRLDQDDDGDRPAEVRQGDEAETGQRRRAVHLGRLNLLAVERLDGGQQDQRREGQPLPGDDHDDREQRDWLRKSIGCSPQTLPEMPEKPVIRVHEHVLPDQRRNRRHHEERRDHQDAHDALAPHRLVEQQRQRRAKQDGDGKH